MDNGKAANPCRRTTRMSVIRKPQKSAGKIMQATALIAGSSTFTLNLNELHEALNATNQPATTVDWHHLAAS